LTIKPQLTGLLKDQENLTKILNQIKYTQELETVVIATEEGILKGREQDRKKISMPAIPLNKDEEADFKHGKSLENG
jgi:hypothetical protein